MKKIAIVRANPLIEEVVVEKQLPISDSDKLKLVDLRRNIFNDKVNSLAEDMYSGKISLGKWEEDMKKSIREVHASVTAIANGGWDNMTSEQWGRIGTPLREQYKYLHEFSKDIHANSDTISLKAIQARARLYGLASSGTAAIIQAGPLLESLLPWMPRDGSTECFFMSDKVHVMTRDNGSIRLASVKVGDYVLSHLGHFRKVLAITSADVENVNSVELLLHVGRKNVKVATTPDHLFRTINGWIRADEIDATTKLSRIGKKCKRVGCDTIVNIQSHYDKDACCSRSCDSIANKKWVKAHEKNHELIKEGKFIFQVLQKDPVFLAKMKPFRSARMLELAKGRIGKTYDEMYGTERAIEIKDKVGISNRGISWEEHYGEERANELKEKTREFFIGNKFASGPKPQRRGSFIEKYGEERAAEICKKLSAGTKSQWARNYKELRELIIAGNKRKCNSYSYDMRSKPEIRMAELLNEIGIEYIEQKWLFGKYRVDFVLPIYNAIIEVDGKHWHNMPGRAEADKNREFEILKRTKYSIFRFDANQVMKYSTSVKDTLIRTFANHDGDYKLVNDVEVISIIRKIRSGTVKCLVVEDDESFVATAGLISHNCLIGCKCYWKFKIVSRDPKTKLMIVSAIWKLSPAEHCVDCLDRRNHEEILTLPLDYEVPSFIGGY
jgi:very-short-patch-repair endonuclease